MSASVKVYGYSDDIIVVEGGGLDDEFYDPFLHFSDGTILEARYSPKCYRGKWRIQVVKQGTATIEIVPAPDTDKNCSDIATLAGEIVGVEAWRHEQPSRYEITEKITNYDIGNSEASRESLLQAWRLISGKV